MGWLSSGWTPASEFLPNSVLWQSAAFICSFSRLWERPSRPEGSRRGDTKDNNPPLILGNNAEQIGHRGSWEEDKSRTRWPSGPRGVTDPPQLMRLSIFVLFFPPSSKQHSFSPESFHSLGSRKDKNNAGSCARLQSQTNRKQQTSTAPLNPVWHLSLQTSSLLGNKPLERRAPCVPAISGACQ